MKKLVLCLLLTIFIASNVLSQDEHYIMGIVVDKKTKEPIQFASVFWKETTKGVVTNENGSFKIYYDKNDQGNTLKISCIAYKSIEIASSDLVINKITKYKLENETYDIDEVTIQGKKIRTLAPKNAVRQAIKNITKNHPTHAFLLKGYYRDYIKVENNYLNLYESIVELEDFGFNANDFNSSRIKSIYGRMNKNFEYDSLKSCDYSNEKNKRVPSAEMGYQGGNELSILRISDPIRNYNENSFDFVNQFDTDFLKNHEFTLKEITYIDGEPYYVIGFEYFIGLEKLGMSHTFGAKQHNYTQEKYSNTEFEANGLIYIHKENFKIKKMTYTLYMDDKIYGRLKGWEMNLEYQNYEEKNHLKYISFNNVFEIPDYNDSVYFYLKYTKVDKKQNQIRLEFNNKVDIRKSLKASDFKIYLRDKKLNVSQIYTSTKHPHILFLTVKGEASEDLINSFNPRLGHTIQVKMPNNLYDTNGNKLYKYKSVMGYQFREFFVNDVSINYTPLNKEDCVDKWESLKKSIYKDVDKTYEVFFNSPLLF